MRASPTWVSCRWALGFALGAAVACAAWGAGFSPDEFSPRVRQLLASMSREEKLAIIRGGAEPAEAAQSEAGWTAGVPRLHIPDLRFADGPQGVLVRHLSTGMPGTLVLASTFSVADAEADGALIARDARALGVDVILQPYINIYRDPTFERAYNTLGEDPVLTGALAARFVHGAQANGVMAQAKHYVAYDGAANALVDGQALREIYAAPFREVSEAGVASIMCSYNQINGVYSCGNAATLNGILRGEIGFRGFVTSDWGAAHGAEFIAAGMDMEQPGTGPDAYFALGKEPEPPPPDKDADADLQAAMNTGVPEEQGHPMPKTLAPPVPPVPGVSKNLGEALTRGTVTEADIDRAAGHVLTQLERFGWLDHAPNHKVGAQDIAGNARIVQRLAEHGSVLLKNDGILPFSRADVDTLALIGPGARQTFAIVTGEEQSYGRAEREVGAWQALQAQTQSKGLRLAVADDMTGVPIPASAFTQLTRALTLRGASTSSSGAAADIDQTIRSHAMLPAGAAAKWNGSLVVPADGEYEINLQVLGATGRFWIDGRSVGNMAWWGGHGDIVFPNRESVIPTTDGLANIRRLVRLAAGAHTLRVEASADGSGLPVQVRLAWVTPTMKEQAFAEAVEAAKAAKAAVVFAWSRGRPAFGLPGDQDRLIEAVAAVNPNTIVVLNTGKAVAMPWLDKVRAVLEMWYTGDEGGWAAANLLTGKANPAGRLPITWPKRLEDGVATDPAHPERASDNTEGKTHYSEGVDVGYRWFDHENIEPLFPFGFGLSYTTFSYSHLVVRAASDGGLDVSCHVRNTGRRTGDEVVQLYVGPPDPAPEGVAFAPRALAAFDRVAIAPGATRVVQLHVAPQRLRYWSLSDKAWHDARAGRTVYVGGSSRDLPLSARVTT
ncbi:MAG: glycoside hydrolase family 3 C-terminal domain-containing protein [Proteobacteria bacterium]|nr:glycoside hydrolase family 3 C-terminal domain-containing protein [Pseudomonadota bacterium]